MAFIASQNLLMAQMRTAEQEPFIPGELIIQVEKGTDVNRLLENLPSQYGFRAEQELSPFINAWLIKFKPEMLNQMVALRMIENLNGIKLVQNNHQVELRNTPNDPQFNQQWHHLNNGSGGGTADADIDTDEAWTITTGGTNALGHDIVVCILEGVDFSHVDLIDNRWTNTAEIPGNGIDDDGNGYIDDMNGWNVGNNSGNLSGVATGHGTSVAGMIGAKGNNGVGVVGANWNVKMLNVVGYNMTEASVISAYNYPLTLRQRYNQTNGAEGAFVVATNASWGIDGANPANYPIWCNFYNTLGQNGILNCGATTNSNLNVDVSGDMPTACSSPYMIGVGRSDNNDNFAGGYGLTTINFVAPGINVRTTSNGNNYTTTTGTSFASPLTAGVVALLYAIPCQNFMNAVLTSPQQGSDFVLNALMNGVDQKPQLQNFFVAGGRINAKTSMDLLMEETCSSCVRPTGFSVSNILETSSALNFNNTDDAINYTLFYRPIGSNDWQSMNVSESPFELIGLQSCTVYESYMQAVCANENSNNTPIISFRTKGCGACIDAEYCAQSTTDNPSSRLVIQSPSALETTITNFTLTNNWGGSVDNAYVFGQMALVNDGSTSSNLGCNQLTNGAQIAGKIAVAVRGNCDFSTKAFNAQNAGAIGLVIINNQGTAPASLGAGANAANITIPVVMISQAQGTNLLAALQNSQTPTAFLGRQNEWIQTFQIAGQTFNTGDNSGYLETVDSNLILASNTNYNFTLTPGHAGQALQQYTRIWIDMNLNGEFESNELVYDQSNASTNVVNGVINMPSSVTEGNSRMRVQMAYQGYGASALPSVCGNFQSGEVEDYCVMLTNDLSSVSFDKVTLEIYPNPSTGIVNFSTNLNEQWQIKIYNAIGQQLKAFDLKDSKQLDFNHLSNGLYLIQGQSESGFVKTQKLILKK